MKDTEYQKGFGYTVMSNTNSVHAPHIVVLGSANVDISARTPVFPRDGETVTGDTVLVSTGGKGTNQAVSASRAGAQVTMIGRLGCDFFADIPAKLYEREGIDTRFVGRDSEHGTGCALIEVHTGTGENRITVVPGANMAVTAEDVAAAEAEIAKADILLTQRETHPDSIEAFLKLGAKYGKKVILNPAPALPIPDAWYPLIDTITPNETEAEAYTGVTVTDDASALRAAEIFAGRGVRCVIITCGKRGVFCAEFEKNAAGEPVCTFHAQVAAFRVQAVDTTGAGDAFNGALCTALAEGCGVIDACRFATTAATLSVTRAGAAEAMASRAEIDTLYNRFYHSGKTITPTARRLAAELGLFWRALDGTGPDGTITEQDVRNAQRNAD